MIFYGLVAVLLRDDFKETNIQYVPRIIAVSGIRADTVHIHQH